jgi:hypothetical protein
MCGVIFVALAITAYLAVYFNRRAKADLQAALEPLASLIDGTVDVDNAQVTGRYDRKLVIAQMAHAEGGPVRVFRIDLIDSAGGTGWRHVSLPSGRDGEGRHEEWTSECEDARDALTALREADVAAVLGSGDEWYQVEYAPDGGYVRATRPMETRKDLPSADAFGATLAWLSRLADQNRAVQESRPFGGPELEQHDGR